MFSATIAGLIAMWLSPCPVMQFSMYVRTADGVPLSWTRFQTDSMALAADAFAHWKQHPYFVGSTFVLVSLFGGHLLEAFDYAAPVCSFPEPAENNIQASYWLN